MNRYPRHPSHSRRAKPLRFDSPALLARAEREFAALLAPPPVRVEAVQMLPAFTQVAAAVTEAPLPAMNPT